MVWQDAIQLFKMVYEMTRQIPYELSKTRNNILDASHSISRNIAEGYCRKNLREYLNFLNISLGSCGELLSGMISFREIDAINEENFDRFDKLHFKTENGLLKLIKALQAKENKGDWKNKF
jgi:four helix bundle protein